MEPASNLHVRPLQSQASPADSLTTAETIPAAASAEVTARNLLEAIGKRL